MKVWKRNSNAEVKIEASVAQFCVMQIDSIRAGCKVLLTRMSIRFAALLFGSYPRLALMRPAPVGIELEVDPGGTKAKIVFLRPPIATDGSAANVARVINVHAIASVHVAAKAELDSRVLLEKLAKSHKALRRPAGWDFVALAHADIGARFKEMRRREERRVRHYADWRFALR